MTIRFSPLALVLYVLSASVFAQDPAKVKIETTRLADKVYMMQTRIGGNLGVCAGEDGVILVDSEYAGLGAKVKEAIASISPEPVKFVINTHWHFDHTGGNKYFHDGGSVIVAHENVRRLMADDQYIGIINRDVPASPKEALPAVTFTDSVTFLLNGEEIEVFHTPNAHTDGDGVVHFRKANVIHAGDIFFNTGYPFIDVTNGGNINGMIAAVEMILKRCNDETKIIPGHGPLSDKAGLESYLAMLREFRDIISKEIDMGKDLKAILKAKPTAELDKKWGQGAFPPNLFTEMVYRSFQKD